MPRILLKCTLWHSYLQKAFTHKYRGREKNDIRGYSCYSSRITSESLRILKVDDPSYKM